LTSNIVILLEVRGFGNVWTKQALKNILKAAGAKSPEKEGEKLEVKIPS
jgi:hypothetical protein